MWIMHGYARICLKDHRGRVEMTLWSRALPPPGHFDSQIKDSSNSFRRRHSNEVFFEDIPAKALMPNLGSTKPKPLSFKLCICMID